MGDSFAAGTIDGPGAFSFHQNDTTGNKLWDIVGHLIHEPSKQQEQCHHPKPILLDIGEAEWPYPWAPKVVPLQIFGVGQMFIVAVPAEFTTMSGRHLRAAISKVLNESKVEGNPFPVIAGLANTYSDYVATYYEYQQQRYEAASTIFGPYTLDAYIQEYTLLAKALVGNGSIDAGPSPPDYTNKQISLHFPLLKDKAPSGKNFGDVKTDVQQTYKKGDVVEVEFWSGNPRYNRMTENTYLTVDLQASDGSWSTLYTDSSFETRFSWKYDHSDVTCIVDDIFGGCTSYMTIQWFIPADAQLGTYRIKHFGAYNDIKNLYTGTSASFKVTA
jgi:neutral ceramidase